MGATNLEEAVESLLVKVDEPLADDDNDLDDEEQHADDSDEDDADDSNQDADVDDDDDESDDSDSDDDDDDDDEYDDDEDDDDDQEPLLHTVKVDGVERKVTLDELRQGFSGQEHIQKGMRENAEQRKILEQGAQALQAKMQQATQLVEQLSQNGLLPEPKLPTTDDFDADPLRAMQEQIAYNQQKAAYDKQQAELQQLAQDQAAANETAMTNFRRAQAAELIRKMPEIKTQEDFNKFEARISKGAEHYGFNAQEIANVFDHRAKLIMHDALKYRELQAGKEQAKDKAAKKSKKAKPMVKPGAKKAPQNVAKKRQDKQRARLQKTGRMEDAVDLILNS